MKTTHPSSFPSLPLPRRAPFSIATAVAAVIAGSAGALAQYTGEFSAAFVGNGNSDALVGLSASKNYLYAVDLGTGAANLVINGVNFTGLAGVNPSVAGQWGFTGVGNQTNTGVNNITGQLGTLTTGFIFGGTTVPEVLTVNALTVGQTYVITFYNRSFEAAATPVPTGGRRQTMTASGASSVTGGFTFDEDIGATAQGSLTLLRYTFQAATTQQLVSFVAQVSGTTMHQYGFSVESVFNNTYASGADWTTAAWSGGVPNAQGANAAFAATGGAINLNTDVTVGHVQFDGANAWTLGTSSGRTLTLQTDVAGVSTLSAKAGAHTISTNIALLNNVMKTGAGALTLDGAVSGPASVHLAGGILTLNGVNSYTGETVIAGGGTVNVTTVSDYGVPSSIGARTLAQENNTVTGVGLHFQGGTLKFIGSTAQSTNRNIRVLNGTAGATIDASGTNPAATLSFTKTGTNVNLFDTGGTRTINLTGTNAGDNSFSIQLTNQAAAATSLTKSGVGTWVLNGPDANTHTGTTTITNGVLKFAKTGVTAAAGPIVIGNGTAGALLHLGGTGGNQIADTSSVSFAGSGATAGILRMNDLSETVASLVSAGGAGIVENESGSAGTGTLTVNVVSGSPSFAGILRNGDGVGTDGTLAFTKIGGGTQVLTGASTHTGATTVNGGALLVDGSLAAGSAVSVTGATLGGAGVISGAVTLSGAGRISPGTAVTAAELKVGGLTIGAGTFLDLEFGGTSDLVNVTGTGALAINGGSFNLYAAGGVTPLVTNGLYTVIDYAGSFTGAITSFGVNNAQIGKFYAITNDGANTLIQLTVADAVTTEWSGVNGNGQWGMDGNWTANAANSPGALAKFGTIPGGATSVAVNGPKTVGSIIFDNANSYTLNGGAGDTITINNGIATAGISVVQGAHTIAAPIVLVGNTTSTTAAGTTLTIAGDISGAKMLTAAGAGTTILTGANTYGETSVTGTLQIGNAGTTGTLGAGDVTVAGGGTLAFNRSNDLTVSNNILGASGQVTQNGAGTLTLSGTNGFGTASGGLTVNTGVVKVGSAGAIPSAVLLTVNSIFDLNQTAVTVGSLSGIGGQVTDNSASGPATAFTVNQAGTTTFDGVIADGPSRGLALTKTGAGTLTLAGASQNNYTGGTVVTGGVLRLAKSGVNAIPGDVVIGDATGSDVLLLGASDQIVDSSVLTFTAGGSGNSAFFHLNGFNETIKGIQTTVGNAAVIANAAASGTSTLTIDTAGSDYAYDGIIRNGAAGTMAITKAGAGTLTLANTAVVAATNYTGVTSIDGGNLVLSNLSAFTSPITINSTAADALTFNQTTRNLTVASLISGPGALTINAGNFTLTLSGVNGGLSGLITLNSGTLGIGNNGTLGFGPIVINGGILRAAGAARIISNPVTVNGSFTLGRLTDFSNVVTLGANVTITANNFDGPANNNSRFNAGIDGPFTVTFAQGPQLLGTGAIVIAGVNTNSGGTVVESGRVLVEATGALANAPLAVNGGVVAFLNNQELTSLTIADGGTVVLGALPPPAPPAPGLFGDGGFGAEAGDLAGAGPQAVPEPGSAALVFGGILTLLGLRRAPVRRA